MRGTVTKKRDRWYICYYVGKDAKGKWKQKWEGSWDTKKAAERVLRQRISELEETFERKGESCTLKVYLQRWLDTYCTERLAPNTIRGYRVNVEKHIVPYIGQIRLDALRPSDIQGLYSSLLTQGLSGTTVRYVHNNLHRALAVAVRQQLMSRNPADCVEPPVIERYEAATLNDEQIRRLLVACRGTEIYTPVLLAVTLGLRRGEVLGLQWQDIDWQRSTLSVRRSASFRDGGMVMGATKTRSSRRTLLLPSGVACELKEIGKGRASGQPVCCRADGSIMTTNALYHQFAEVLEQSKLPHIRFHDLRHTYATLMLRNGVPAKIASSILGHSSIGITLNTYSHVVTEMQQGAVGVVDDILNGSC